MKRKKLKSNQALALCLCALFLLCSIGLVLAQAGKTPEEYSCEDLKLTQFQSGYDLKSGIKYDDKKYVLSVTSPGGFDINTPGTYQVAYQLTPVIQTAEPLSSPEPSGGKPASVPSGGGGSAPVPSGGGGSAPVPSGGKSALPLVKTDDTKRPQPVQTEKEKPESTPSLPPVKTDDTKRPQPVQTEKEKPAEQSAPARPHTEKPAKKPQPAKPAREKAEQQSAPAKTEGEASTVQSEQSKPDAEAPEKKSAPVGSDQNASDAKQEPVKSESISASQTLFTNSGYGLGAEAASAWLSRGINDPAAARSLALLADNQPVGKDQDSGSRGGQDAAPASGGNQSGSADAPSTGGKSGSQSGDKKSDSQSGSQSDSKKPETADTGSASGQSGSSDKKEEQNDSSSAGGKSGSQSGDKKSDSQSGSQSDSKQPGAADPGSASGQSGSSAKKEEQSDSVSSDDSSSRKKQSDSPSTGGKSGDQSGHKKPGGADSGNKNGNQPGDKKPGSQSGSQSGSKKPKTADPGSKGGQSSPASAGGKADADSKEGQSGSPSTGSQPGEGSASADSQTGAEPVEGQSSFASPSTGDAASGLAPGEHEAPLMPIDFTRTIIVEPAVSFDNLQLDIHSARANLYEGITYDPKQFAVSIQKDQDGLEENSHFSIDRINEYQVTYDLTRLSDNEKVSEFQRYVWVTAPDVTFDAPPLSVDPSGDVDLFQNITYDHTKYEISLVDPNAFDPAKKGVQRIMYRLTPRPGAQSQSDQETAPSDASDSTEDSSDTQNPATRPDSTSETQLKSASETQPEAASETHSQSSSATQPKSALKAQPEAAPSAQSKSALTTQQNSASKAQPEAAPSAQPNSTSETQLKSASETQPEAASEDTDLVKPHGSGSDDSGSNAKDSSNVADSSAVSKLPAAGVQNGAVGKSQSGSSVTERPKRLDSAAKESDASNWADSSSSDWNAAFNSSGVSDSSAASGASRSNAVSSDGSVTSKAPDSNAPSHSSATLGASHSSAVSGASRSNAASSDGSVTSEAPDSNGAPHSSATLGASHSSAASGASRSNAASSDGSVISKAPDSNATPHSSAISGTSHSSVVSGSSDSDVPSNTSTVSDTGDGSVTSDTSASHTYVLAAAIFGRDVVSGTQPFIKWDVKPLVITRGAVESVDLLSQVKAVNEMGEPVQVVVQDRSQIDTAIQEAEAQSRSGDGSGPQILSPSAGNQLSASDQTAASDQPSGSGQAQSRSGDDLGPQILPPSAGNQLSASNQPSGSGQAQSRSGDGSGPQILPPSAGNQLSASNQTSASDQTAASDQLSDSDQDSSQEILVGEDSTLTAADLEALPPGNYHAILRAMDPDTGMESTQILPIMLRMGQSNGGSVTLTASVNDAKPGNPIPKIVTMKDAFVHIFQTQYATSTERYHYFVTVTDGYSFTTADQAALLKLQMKNPYITVTIRGKGKENRVSTDNAPDMFMGEEIRFPYVPDSSQYASFALDKIWIKPKDTGNRYIEAQGSRLTLGSEVSLFSSGTTTYTVIGGSRGANPGPLNTDLTVYKPDVIQCYGDQQYYYICGGNYGADTTGTTHLTIDGVYMPAGTTTNLYAGSGGGDTINQYGDSYLTIRGNTDVDTAYGGPSGSLYSDPSDPTRKSTAHVTMESGNVKQMLYGGSGNNQFGNSEVTIEGGTVNTVYGGGKASVGDEKKPFSCSVTVNGGSVTTLYGGVSNKGLVYGTIDIRINGGNVTGMRGSSQIAPGSFVNIFVKGEQNGSPGAQVSGLWAPAGSDQTGLGKISLDVSGTLTMNKVEFIDELKLEDHAHFTVTTPLHNSTNGFGLTKGRIVFGTKSTLSLSSPKPQWWESPNQIGSFQTNGPGAVLELNRENSVVYTKYAGDMATLTEYPLTLRLLDPDGANTGTTVFTYSDLPGYNDQTGKKALASHTEWYKGDFPRGLEVGGDPNTGIISIGKGGIGLQSKEPGLPDAFYGTISYYGTVANAVSDIKADGKDYMVSVRKSAYSLTPADGLAIAGAKVSPGCAITYTSQFVATKDDLLLSSTEIGERVKRTVLIGPDLPPGTDAVISFPTITYVSDINLQYSANGAIFANGNKLTINEGVDVQSQASYFPILYGGSPTATVDHTELHIAGGKFSGIYGGGMAKGANVTGEANIDITGGYLTGPLHGGGKAGDVGNVKLNITGGHLQATKNANGDRISGKENLVILGGETGNVTTGCTAAITGGDADGPTTVAGCDRGNTGGDVTISITKTGDETTIKTPLANVYGGGLNGGIVKGSVSMSLNSGSDYATISGGGNPGFSWPAGQSAYTSVKGKKSIFIAGDVLETWRLLNFDLVKVGSEKQTNLTVKGDMDYNPKNDPCLPVGDPNTPPGTLSLGMAVVNFSREEKVPGYAPTLRIKNLNVTNSGDHLHVYKDENGTHPLTIEGKYTGADKTTKINLGIIDKKSGGADDGGAPGDVLLKFPNKNAEPNNYIADSSSMEITTNEDRTEIRYGRRDYPQGAMTGVSLTSADGIDVIGAAGGDASSGGGTVTKRLSFLFHSNHTDGSYSGVPVAAAYVDTSPGVDKSWADAVGDTPPAGGAKVLISQEKSTAADPHFWTGEAVVTIPAPTSPGQYVEHYAHVKTVDHTSVTIACDVEPILPSSGNTADETAANGDGSYTFTRSFLDYVFPTTEPKIPYTASGLSQWGWSVGSVSGPDRRAIGGAIQNPMIDTADPSIPGGLTTGSFDANLYQVQPVTFTVPVSEMGLKPGDDPITVLKDKVVYIFLKDKMGNTSELRIPMSQSRISFTLPTRVGIIALRDPKSSLSQVLAPTCYITNNDTNKDDPAIRVDITGTEIPSGSAPLKFVNTRVPGPWTSDEITVLLKSVPGSQYFSGRSILDIHDSPTQTLTLGNMWPKGATDGSGNARPSYVNFTFGAQFNPQINLTRDWSRFSLTYRFTILPKRSALTPKSEPDTDQETNPPLGGNPLGR